MNAPFRDLCIERHYAWSWQDTFFSSLERSSQAMGFSTCLCVDKKKPGSPKTSCATRGGDSVTPAWFPCSFQATVPHHHDNDAQGCPLAVLEHTSFHHQAVQPHSPPDAVGELRKVKFNEAVCLHFVQRKQLQRRSCPVYDCETHWREIANSAEAADKAGDARSTYRLIRSLGAFRTTTLPGIKLADGSFALDAEQESEIWNEHFAALLCGDLVDTLVEPPAPATPVIRDVDEAVAANGPLTDEVQHMNTSLPNNNALGMDQIPAELWKAGHEVTSRICFATKLDIVHW